jgi:hypothetical protein
MRSGTLSRIFFQTGIFRGVIIIITIGTDKLQWAARGARSALYCVLLTIEPKEMGARP